LDALRQVHHDAIAARDAGLAREPCRGALDACEELAVAHRALAVDEHRVVAAIGRRAFEEAVQRRHGWCLTPSSARSRWKCCAAVAFGIGMISAVALTAKARFSAAPRTPKIGPSKAVIRFLRRIRTHQVDTATPVAL